MALVTAAGLKLPPATEPGQKDVDAIGKAMTEAVSGDPEKARQMAKALLTAPGDRGVVAPDGKRMATTGPDGSVRLYDVATGKLLHTRALPAERPSRRTVRSSAPVFLSYA